MKQLRLTIYGNVQGVGFRYWARSKAQALNLKGVAKNESNGTVTIIVQGKIKNLEKFLKMCHSGSLFAQVTNVHSKWEEIVEKFTSFEII